MTCTHIHTDTRTFSISTKSLFLSNFVHKIVNIPVGEHFIICQDNPSTWQAWHIKKLIIIQMQFALGTIKGHSKMCSFDTQHNATDVSSFEEA